jgi:hypothetical protein
MEEIVFWLLKCDQDHSERNKLLHLAYRNSNWKMASFLLNRRFGVDIDTEEVLSRLTPTTVLHLTSPHSQIGWKLMLALSMSTSSV